MSKIRDEHSIDDISKDKFTEELFSSRGFLLELVFDAIYKTSNLEILPKRINSRIKWFINHALDIPLSILIYTGAVFVPVAFRINDRDIVRVEGIFGQSLRELRAKTLNILLKPKLILKYINKRIESTIGMRHSGILITEFPGFPRVTSHHWSSIREIIRIARGSKNYLLIPSAMLYTPKIFLTLLKNWYKLLRKVLSLDYETREGYVPIPVKSRIINESISSILDELEIRVKRAERKPFENEFLAKYLGYLEETVGVLARIKFSLENTESKITFSKLSLQDYDSLVKFIIQTRRIEKRVDEATVRAIILDKLYLKTIIPATTVTSDLVELAINLFSCGSSRLGKDYFSRLQNRLYKYKTKFNQAVNNVKNAVKDNILELDMGSIELVDRRSQQTYQYLSDKIRVFREASPTCL